MASELDDNPFARNSPWPRMPQAPFRVGPLPKASAAPPASEAVAAPRAITPAFVRPLDPLVSSGLGGGQAAPRPAQPSAPAGPRPPALAVATAPAPELQAAPDPTPDPQPAPRPYVEVAPVIVQPLGTGVRKRRRRSPVPAIAAAGAGLAAILGVAYALNRGQEAAFKSTAPQTVPAVVAASAPAVAAPALRPPARASAVAPARKPTRPAAAPPRVTALSTVTDEAAVAPVISLPPAPVAAPKQLPETEPLPSYAPPAAPDPNAPVVTRTPD